jgi:hypothetical protein
VSRSVGQDEELGSQLVAFAEVEDALYSLHTSTSTSTSYSCLGGSAIATADTVAVTALARSGVDKATGAIPEQLDTRQRHPTGAQRDTTQLPDFASLLLCSLDTFVVLRKVLDDLDESIRPSCDQEIFMQPDGYTQLLYAPGLIAQRISPRH